MEMLKCSLPSKTRSFHCSDDSVSLGLSGSEDAVALESAHTRRVRVRRSDHKPFPLRAPSNPASRQPVH